MGAEIGWCGDGVQGRFEQQYSIASLKRSFMGCITAIRTKDRTNRHLYTDGGQIKICANALVLL